MAVQDLVISRVFNAPRSLVWKAWTEPESLMRWWGPKGYTSPACNIDLRPNGKYLFGMRSPEGTNTWSTGTYREIVPQERLVCTDSFADENGNVVPATHYGMSEDFPLEMRFTITLEDLQGKTHMTVRHEGLPAGEMQEMTRIGWNQSFDKLEQNLLAAAKAVTGAKKSGGVEVTFTHPSDREMVMTCNLDAPRELVFNTYTDPKLMPHWWGPRFLTTTVEKMEVRPGGTYRIIQRDPSGNEFIFHGEYREFIPPRRIVHTFEFEGMPGHISLNTETFEDRGGQTLLTTTVLMESAEDMKGMLQTGAEDGMAESMDRLSELLAKLRTRKAA